MMVKCKAGTGKKMGMKLIENELITKITKEKRLSLKLSVVCPGWVGD